jgi:hypothetical protein
MQLLSARTALNAINTLTSLDEQAYDKTPKSKSYRQNGVKCSGLSI